MSAVASGVEIQVWYLRDGIVTTYKGRWTGEAKNGKNGPFRLFKIEGVPPDDQKGPWRTFTLSRVIKVCRDGRQVYPEPRKMIRASNGRFVRA